MPSFSNSPSADTGHSPHTQIIGKPPVVQHAYLHRDSITNSRLKGSPSVRSTNHSACDDGDSSRPHAARVAAELSHFSHTNKPCKIAHLMPPGSRETAGSPTLTIYFLHLNVCRKQPPTGATHYRSPHAHVRIRTGSRGAVRPLDLRTPL